MQNDDKPGDDNRETAVSVARHGDAVPDEERSESPVSAAQPPAATGRAWALVIALAALLLGIGGILAGYLMARHLDTQQQSLAGRAAELQAALESVRQRQDEVTARTARVEGEVPGIKEELSRLGELLPRDAAQRVELADVERLLRMANDSLLLEADIGTALLALQGADRRLRELGDPRFAEVRRVLAREMTELAAVPRPDIAGMAYTLSSLQGELGSLLPKRAAPARPDAGQPAAEGADAGEPPRWRAVLRDVWETFKGLVVVRHREGNELPLVAPEEQLFLTQNLYLKLESARLALLSRDDLNFHASLAVAHAWIADYYDGGTAAVAAVSARIGELDKIDIAPPLPDLSGSLTVLQTELERRGGAVRDDGA